MHDQHRGRVAVRPARRAGLPPVAAPPAGPADAVWALQRQAGNQAVAAVIAVQRDALSRAAGQLGAGAPSALGLIRKYGYQVKTTRQRDWVTRLPGIKANEDFWTQVRDHVMLGEVDDEDSTGYHSIQEATASPVTVVGASTGGKFYKRWTKPKSVGHNRKVKISTFYPSAWSEERIKAVVMLKDSPNKVPGTPALTVNAESVYPNIAGLENPPRPG